ncbi:AbiJ-NTD4 domain-containing protein [Flavobacterium sp. ASV13]|uniref:AbiJ-NTD4 domain-containing protein n=1 Tax=Flavobacterium sp. ASV13 TaxID=1506583 RepID=UPI000551C21E|nr:hypothetical protein [Flavobacterium sp. ASV13]
MRFSERIGKKPIKDILQVEFIDIDLKNRLWNCIIELFFDKISNETQSYGEVSLKMQICEYIWKEFFKQAIDKFPSRAMGGRSIGGLLDYLRKWFYTTEWFEVYDLIEFLCYIDTKANLNLNFEKNCNRDLKKEISGYRIINSKVVQITKDEEIESIENALNNTDRWKSVNIHLNSAITSLAEKTNPNYRNSIKESISAVEALCKIITGDEKATLGKALTEIESKHKIHRALKSAFSAIYGYTSDSGGIRHSLLESDNSIDLDEAKFMLISCSAFINYLIAKSE